MQLTKYEHACFTLEKDGQLLVVDPGEFTLDFIAPEHVVGIVITHDHSDHFDPEQLAMIIDKNPGARIVGPESVTAKIEAFDTQSVTAGDRLSIGPFALEFFGGQHARIHTSIPQTTNVGVFINDLVYYPGDSFTLPGRPIDTLALPVAAPWLKVSEVMDFLALIHPRLAFPTHDAILSDIGKELADGRLKTTAQQIGSTYQRLNDPIVI